MDIFRCITLIAFSIFYAASEATAVDFTYTGGGSNGNWATSANWTPGLPVSATTTSIFFNATTNLNTTQNLNGNFFLNSTTVSSPSGSITVGGSLIRFGGSAPLIQNNSSGTTFTINTSIVFDANTTIGGNHTVRLTGQISGVGALFKTGAGMLVLGNFQNTWLGGTTISSGEVRMQNDSAFPPQGDIALRAGTINMFSFFQTVGNLNLGVSGATAPAQINTGSGGILTLNGPVNYTASAQQSVIAGNILDLGNANRTFTIANGSQVIDLKIDASIRSTMGSFGITLAGDGRCELTGANLYSGTTIILANAKLLVNNLSGSGTGTGSVDVLSNGQLCGIGTIAPAAGNGISCAGTLLPGPVPGAIGMMTLGKSTMPTNVSLTNGTLIIDVTAATADLLRVFGTVGLNGATLSLSGIPDPGITFVLIDATTIDGTFGSVQNMPVGFEIQYSLTSVFLTPIPVPEASLFPILALFSLYSARQNFKR